MAFVSIKMDGVFKKQLKRTFKNKHADVGILQDRRHRKPVSAAAAKKKAQQGAAQNLVGSSTVSTTHLYKTYAGGPTRRTGKGSDGTVSGVSEQLRRHTGINIFTRPWKSEKNREIVRFAKLYIKGLVDPQSVTKKRIENLLQAVVRNPIIRGDYGRNSPAAAKIKGFNRFMIDTGQLVKNIKARVFSRV
jgi:hypothetical protein